MADWVVYMVKCADESLYVGITTDVARRLEEHNGDDRRAAKYTRGRRPVTLVYQENVASRSRAASREHQIRQLSRKQKTSLLGS